MTKLIPARVALQQRVFPEYRAPFFSLLAQSCLQGFSLFSGQPRPEEAIHTSDQLPLADYQPGNNVHLSRGRTYFCLQPELVPWLERWKPNVLIVEANARYLSTPSAIRWMRARHHPVIGWGLGAPPAGRLENSLRGHFFRSLDAVIAYSKTGADQYIAAGFDPKHVFVAANAVAPRPTQPAPARSEHFAGGKPNLIFVGRLQPRKQLDVLFQACASLPSHLQPNLIVVGDGPDRPRLEATANAIFPSVQFTGAKHGTELAALFDRADLFVLPGTGGLAVQQAMAHALPVIVGQADGTQSELVRPENGWVLSSPTADALANTLLNALQDVNKLRKMGQASYRIVSEEVNLEAMVDTFAKAIQSVL